MGDGEVKLLEEEMDRMQKGLQPLQSFTLPGGGVLNAFPPSGAHRMPSGRARMLGGEARRADQRTADGLYQSAQRPSVRTIAMDREAARRAGISVGSRPAACTSKARPARSKGLGRAKGSRANCVELTGGANQRDGEYGRLTLSLQAQIGPMANFVYSHRRS